MGGDRRHGELEPLGSTPEKALLPQATREGPPTAPPRMAEGTHKSWPRPKRDSVRPADDQLDARLHDRSVIGEDDPAAESGASPVTWAAAVAVVLAALGIAYVMLR